jgi:hypothetical protein
MNGRISKKIRKQAKKDYGEMMELLAEKNGRMLKPKPRFFPQAWWIFLLRFFVYIKK